MYITFTSKYLILLIFKIVFGFLRNSSVVKVLS